MPRLHILHDFHPQDVCVNWKSQLLGQLVDFSLLHVEQSFSIIQPAIKVDFNVLPLLDLLSQSLLVLVNLLLLLLIVHL